MLRVSIDGGDNVVVGGLMGSFTTGSGNDRFVIEDPSLLGLTHRGRGQSLDLATMVGRSPGGGGNDTFYVTGGGSGNKFGHVVRTSRPRRQATLDFSNSPGGRST